MAANLLEKRVASKSLFIRHTTRLIRRKFCAVAVQEEKEGHQTGIPLIIAPHVIRRAFIVHPSTKEVNASLKYQWFTKTKLYEGLPSSLSDVDRYFSVEEYEVVKEPFRNSVLQNYGFRKEATNDRKNERSQELLKLGVLQDLLRFGWSFADRYPHLNDCFLDFEPKIKIHWVRHHNFYQLEHKRPKPAYIIRAKEPAALFEPGMIVYCTSLSITIIAFLPIPLKPFSNTLRLIRFLTTLVFLPWKSPVILPMHDFANDPFTMHHAPMHQSIRAVPLAHQSQRHSPPSPPIQLIPGHYHFSCTAK